MRLPHLDGSATFRIDRGVSLLMQRYGRNRPKASDWLPVLMYHSVGEAAERPRHPYFGTATSPAVFAAHLDFLQQHGYRSVTLAQLQSGAWREVRVQGGKPVLITFDDGYRDFYLQAAPRLTTRGFRAAVFLVTDLTDGRMPRHKDRPGMNWREVRELAEEGFEFGSHTVSHAVLEDLSRHRLEYELSHSKDRIEQEIGREVIAFAYPYAFPQTAPEFLHHLEGQLGSCGYRLGFTTEIGGWSPGAHPLFIPRLPVNDYDDLRLLAAKLTGAYNWLGRVQRGKKAVAHWLQRVHRLEPKDGRKAL